MPLAALLLALVFAVALPAAAADTAPAGPPVVEVVDAEPAVAADGAADVADDGGAPPRAARAAVREEACAPRPAESPRVRPPRA